MHATPTDVHHGATCDADLENALELRATYSQKLRVKLSKHHCMSLLKGFALSSQGVLVSGM